MNEAEILAIAPRPPDYNSSNREVVDGHSGECWFNKGIEMDWHIDFDRPDYRNPERRAYGGFGLVEEDDGSLWWQYFDWSKGDVFGNGDDPWKEGAVTGPEHLKRLFDQYL